jgi:hypothetical protein
MGALGNDDLFALSRIVLALDRVDRLLNRATKQVAQALSAVDKSDPVEFVAAEERRT